MKIIKTFVQVIGLLLLSAVSNLICTALHVSAIPGSIVGLLLLCVLLQLHIVKLEWVSFGGDWLISNLLLFFVPAFLGIVQYGHIVRMDGLRLVCVIAVSTTLVMLSAGLLGEQMNKWRERKLYE